MSDVIRDYFDRRVCKSMGFVDPKDFESAIDCLVALDRERVAHANEVADLRQRISELESQLQDEHEEAKP